MQKKPRPKILNGDTTKVPTGCGNMYVTVNKDPHDGENGLPMEVFASLGKSGGCAKAMNEAVTRLITLCLRYDIPQEELIDQLENIRCSSPMMFPEEQRNFSCPDAIARVLKSRVR